MQDEQLPDGAHPPELIQEFLDLQRRELDVRSAELERDRFNDGNAHEYSLKSLDAQRENEARLVQLFADNSKRRWNWFFLVVILLFVFCGACLFLGKDEMLTQVITYLAAFAGGGGAGYVYGKKDKHPLP